MGGYVWQVFKRSQVKWVDRGKAINVTRAAKPIWHLLNLASLARRRHLQCVVNDKRTDPIAHRK